jgi:ribosomal protein S18 acetylase RimI-like enzyme
MDTSGSIRCATIGDLPQIIAIEQRSFHSESAYSASQLRYLIQRAHSTCFLHEQEDKIHGFIIILFRRGTGVAGIETISVDPLFRGRGIGKNLLYAAEEHIIKRGIQCIRLEVSCGNTTAIKLYYKLGFRIIFLLKNYYYYKQYDTHHAYRMIKEVTT